MTQHLGGDINHTHLVRGMDWSLLARVTSNISQGKSSIDGLGEIPSLPTEDSNTSHDHHQDHDKDRSSFRSPLTTPSGSHTADPTKPLIPPRIMRTISMMKDFLLERRESDARKKEIRQRNQRESLIKPLESFLSGRSSFRFVVEGSVTKYRDMAPVMVLHSIEETRKHKPRIRPSLADPTFQRLIKTFHSVRKLSRKKSHFPFPSSSSSSLISDSSSSPSSSGALLLDQVPSAYPDRPIVHFENEECFPFLSSFFVA